MLFNMLVRKDDHPRNHGFLVDDGRMSLSPAYVPTLFGVGTGFRLLGGRAGKRSNPRKCVEPLRQYGLSKEQARTIVQQLLQ